MRSLPMLSLALVLTALTACDKAGDDKDKVAENADAAKADAKKAGEAEAVASNDPAEAADPESGCIHPDKPKDAGSCDHAAAAAGGESTGHFGAEFAVAQSQPLSAVLASALPTEAVKVSGTVESVCQAKGCWMVITEGDFQARVLVKDHAFAIPMDGKGKAAIVEGTLEVKELSEANVKHLKEDGDKTIEGDEARKEFFLHATAVELAANS